MVLAAACEYCSAWLIFISSDAVFDGTAPPYAENMAPNPLSEYGWHKLHAEKLVLAACPRAAVLRLPLLYGPVQNVSESEVTAIYGELKNGKNVMDSWQKCYPTWTQDVAQVMRAMVEMHLAGTELYGIFHWQGRGQYTKYEIACVIASACGFDAPCAEPRLSSSRSNWAPVAEDARLDCSRLESMFASMGIRPPSTPLQEGLKMCLSPFYGGELVFLQNVVTEPSKMVSRDMPSEQACNSPTYDTISEVTATPTPSTPDGYADRRNLRQPRKAADATPVAGKSCQGDALSNSGAHGDKHATRAAALKNIFREELELAWRRYRDAANDGKVQDDFPSRATIAFLDRHNRRGVMAGG